MRRSPLVLLVGVAVLAAACSDGFDGLTTGEPGVGPAAIWEVPDGGYVSIGQGPTQGKVRVDSACVVLVVTNTLGEVSEYTLAFPEPSAWNPDIGSLRFVDDNSTESADITDGDFVSFDAPSLRFPFSTRPASSCPDDVYFVEAIFEVTPG